ncbi:MAG: rhodanese-like domain-containing protein [Ruminococcaceae bacterium]|nr:rhodanese-like domain-containing protein [Oscillospiraceae bacterium]
MGLLNFLKSPDINEGVEDFRATQGAVLLDVRNPDEYAAGHVPGSVNLPLPMIAEAAERVPDKSTPLFVYCLSGGRSSSAISALEAMGYTNLTNIGGIRAWRGEIEKNT